MSMLSAAPWCRSASSSLCRQVAVMLVATDESCWHREAENEKFPSPTSKTVRGGDMCNANGPKKNRWSSMGVGGRKTLTFQSECHEICLFTAWSAKRGGERGSNSGHHQSSGDLTRLPKWLSYFQVTSYCWIVEMCEWNLVCSLPQPADTLQSRTVDLLLFSSGVTANTIRTASPVGNCVSQLQ